jgi:hypothetical protein
MYIYLDMQRNGMTCGGTSKQYTVLGKEVNGRKGRSMERQKERGGEEKDG